jgi:hypothetical protein
MADNHPRLVQNSKGVRCQRCTGIHEYLTRLSDDTRDCSTPVAFGPDKALKMATLLANGAEDVVRIPDDTIVVMDDSARRLPRSGTGTIRLAQFTTVTRSA